MTSSPTDAVRLASSAEGGVSARTKERPILFSGPMVRGLLAGRKTQTRRAVKGDPVGMVRFIGADNEPTGEYGFCATHTRVINRLIRCPYGVPGDVLWVREAWRLHGLFSDVARIRYQASERQSWTEQHEDFPAHLAAGLKDKPGYRPSIHMPRWASRLNLRITDVRVERLQAISADDADAECFGGDYPERVLPEVFPEREGGWGHLSIPECYFRLWDHINGPGASAANPWVWAVSFEVEPPVTRAQTAGKSLGTNKDSSHVDR